MYYKMLKINIKKLHNITEFKVVYDINKHLIHLKFSYSLNSKALNNRAIKLLTGVLLICNIIWSPIKMSLYV